MTDSSLGISALTIGMKPSKGSMAIASWSGSFSSSRNRLSGVVSSCPSRRASSKSMRVAAATAS